MGAISIRIPQIPGKQDIEVDVRINGEKQQLNYRVEVFFWKDCKSSTSNRVECLKEILAGYEKGWQLYYIGTPTDEFVPITFKKINAA